MHSELLRKLPKVDEILKNKRVEEASAYLPHEQVVNEIRAVIDQKRKALFHSETLLEEAFISFDAVSAEVIERLNKVKMSSLRKVINGTGVVLHTNLGRARLSEKAVNAVIEAASGYSTLEYDPEKGQRGSRHSHTEQLIKAITGAEAAMVVNNNAAATMLCLSALGKGRKVLISRGELVEIGGSFRVPEIMEQSGAILKEVGTTNKTRVSDYENAIDEEVGLLLKVHTSNYKIIGFTEEAALEELSHIAKAHELPLVYDLGSGLMVNLERYGIDEPTIKGSLKAGADVVLFSGDKLLGGPQGGIIIGKKKYIDLMKKHPLARVMRIDKMTAAAMEAVFRTYHDEGKAKLEIPALAMLTKPREILYEEAQRLKDTIDDLQLGFITEIEETEGVVGGGSAPGSILPGYGVGLKHELFSASHLEEALRQGMLPIVVKTRKEHLITDVRTVEVQEHELIADKLALIVGESRK